MDACLTRSDRAACSGRVICPCLGVTEDAVRDAVVTLGLRSVHDVRAATGAGDGCTACHRRLRQLLERQALAPPV
jgi:bacterioferritin-associated ferredoxin